MASSIDDDALADLCTLLDTIRDRLDGAEVPFGLAKKNARFTKRDGIEFGGAQGLNCSTFVMLVFEGAGTPLLDETSWESPPHERRREDEGVQEALVEALREDHPQRAMKIAGEVGCTRFRPEEVAGASGSTACPLSFTEGAKVGKEVLRAIGVIR